MNDFFEEMNQIDKEIGLRKKVAEKIKTIMHTQEYEKLVKKVK